MRDFDKFAEKTEGRWAQIFTGMFEFNGRPNSAGWIQCKSPLRDERDASFSFNVHSGWCKDFGTGVTMSGTDMIMQITGLSRRHDAMQYALDAIGQAAPMLTERKSSMADYVMRVWNEAKPLGTGDASWNYLVKRGIKDENILTRLKCRTHPKLKLTDPETKEVVGFYSGMVFQYFRYIKSNAVDSDGVLQGETWKADWCGIHVTHIDESFRKAEHKQAKKMLGISGLSGAVIPLLKGDGKVMTIGEGVESSLAFEQIYKTGSTVVAAGSTSQMGSFQVTDNLMERVEHFNVLGDLDRSFAGQAAAFTLARNIRTRGKAVDVLFPSGSLPQFSHSSGQDWADLL